MNLKNYTTDYLHSLLKTVGKNSESYNEIQNQLASRDIDYEWIDNQIIIIQDVGRSYIIADNVKTFVKHYGLNEAEFNQLSNTYISSIVDEDKAKVLLLVKKIEQWNKQYMFGNFSKAETYLSIDKLLREYLSYRHNVKRDLISFTSKKEDTINDMINYFSISRDKGEEIYNIYTKYNNEINEIIDDKSLTNSQVQSFVTDITADYQAVISKIIDSDDIKESIDEWLEELKYDSMDEFYEKFLESNDVQLDKIEQNDEQLNKLLKTHMMDYHANLITLYNANQDKNTNPEVALDVFIKDNKLVFQEVYQTLKQFDDSRKETQHHAKQVLLDMMDDDDTEALAMLERLRGKKPEKPSEQVKENPLDAVKEALKDCYRKLDGIETMMEGCHEHLQNLESDTFSLTNIILTLMDNGFDHATNVFSDKMDIPTYLKQYKTIQLSVGRFRGIVEAINNLANANDVIIVPENHQKQQYAHLSSVVVTPNELHLIPDIAKIGNVYVDYYKTIFDSEMNSIYEKLGKNQHQFFIMLG
jgi:hypothetical protein